MTAVNRIKNRVWYITEYLLLERRPWLRIEEYWREGIDLFDIHHLMLRDMEKTFDQLSTGVDIRVFQVEEKKGLIGILNSPDYSGLQSKN